MKDVSAVPASLVRRVWRRVAVLLGIAGTAGVVAGLAALLAVGTALGGSAIWARPSPVPLVLWLAALLAIGIWLWPLVRRLWFWNRGAAASEIERRQGWAPGTLRCAVEPGADGPGTSRALVRRQRTWLAQELGDAPPGRLGGRAATSARTFALAGIVAGVVLLGVGVTAWRRAPDRALAAWEGLRHPIRHLKAPPLPPIRVLGASDRVRRGDALGLRIEAPIRDSVLLSWRAEGEPRAEEWVRITRGAGRASVAAIQAPTSVWATAPDGAISDTLHVVPVDPLMLLDVEIALRYPRYTGRESERLSRVVPTLAVPVGTDVTVTGKTTLPTRRAELRAADGKRTEALDSVGARTFRGSFRVRESMTLGWNIEGAAGEPLTGDPDSLRFVAIPDSAPSVQITFPGVDTTMPLSMTQQLALDARDDYGLSRVEVVSWRVSETGERWPDQVDPVPLVESRARASLTAVLDARGRGFFPGDTLRYFVRAYDNAPTPHMGKSQEYALRLPSLDEVRDRNVTDARDLVESARDLAEKARAQEEATQALERTSTESEPTQGVGRRREPNRGEGAAEFGETEAARQTLEDASRLLDQAKEMQEALAELRQAIERSGLSDSSVVEQLQEIESLYRRVLTPELESRIEKLREALAKLDPQQIRDAVQKLAEGSVDFRQRVEQSVELLRRAALEQEFGTLESRAEEMIKQQERLLSATTDPDSLASRTRERAGELSQAADSLARRMEELRKELTKAGVNEVDEQVGKAQSSTQEAGRQNARVGESIPTQPSQAAKAAQQALQRMQQARSELQEGRQQMQSKWRQELVQSLERARAQSMELARRQQKVNEGLNQNRTAEGRNEARSDEVALKRALEQIQKDLSESSRSSLLIDPTLQGLAQHVGQSMDRMLNELGDGTRHGPPNPELGQQAAEGLQELTYRLMEAADGVQGAGSGTGFQEALERLSQMAQQQGQLNAQTGDLSPSLLGAALGQRLRQLADGQRGIAQQLENLNRSMGPRGQVLGRLDAMAHEADEIARTMESGRLSQRVIERQQKLFQRLLDAGRTLERDEYDKERQAERPTTTEVFRPGALPPELLQGSRFPHPGTADLQPFAPVLRRLILEYFDLLNGIGRTGGGS